MAWNEPALFWMKCSECGHVWDAFFPAGDRDSHAECSQCEHMEPTPAEEE